MGTVSTYSEEGWLSDLPSLQRPRFVHACSSYINEDNKQARRKENI